MIQSIKRRKRSEINQKHEERIYNMYLSIIDKCESSQAAYEEVLRRNNLNKKNKQIAAPSTIWRIVKRQKAKEASKVNIIDR